MSKGKSSLWINAAGPGSREPCGDHGGINHCRLLPAGAAAAALCPGPAPAGIQLVMVRGCHSCPAIPDCSQSKQRRDGLCDPAVPSAGTQREALPSPPALCGLFANSALRCENPGIFPPPRSARNFSFPSLECRRSVSAWDIKMTDGAAISREQPRWCHLHPWKIVARGWNGLGSHLATGRAAARRAGGRFPAGELSRECCWAR